MDLKKEIKLSVGTLKKELQEIVAKYPDKYVVTSYCGDDKYASGFSVQDDLIALELCNDKESAIVTKDLLNLIDTYVDDAKVILHVEDDWKFISIETWSDGKVLRYLEDYDDVEFNYDENDVRLLPSERLYDDMNRFVEAFPDRQVYCLDPDTEDIYPIINFEQDDDQAYIVADDVDCANALTVSSFIEKGDWISSKAGVYLILDPKGSYDCRFIESNEDGHIFFEYSIGDEVVIVCRLGKVVPGLWEYFFGE